METGSIEIPPYPKRVVKGDIMGGFSEKPYKNIGTVSVLGLAR